MMTAFLKNQLPYILLSWQLLPKSAYASETVPYSLHFLSKLLADPQTWLWAISITVLLSVICITWLLIMIRRLHNQHWQNTVSRDWPGVGEKKKQKKPISSTKSSHSFPNSGLRQNTSQPMTMPFSNSIQYDVIEYEKVPLPEGFTNTAMLVDTIEVSEDTLQAAFDDEFFSDLTSAVNNTLVMEDVSPLSEAKYWAAFNNPVKAISILEKTYEAEDAPNSWLILIGLYAQTGQQKKFVELGCRFKKIYNAKIPTWEEAIARKPSMRLKDMPDLAERINKVLFSNATSTYLKDLLFDDRGGTRQGFEFGVYCDLVNLFDAVNEGRVIHRCEMICA